jgi:hypothetical protein
MFSGKTLDVKYITKFISIQFFISFNNNNNNNSNNSNLIQIFIIYVLSRQLQGQLQTQHSVDTSNYIMDKPNMKSETKYSEELEEKTH